MVAEVRDWELSKVCERCGRSFICRAGNCWCTTVWVPAAVLEALRMDYRDCLCKRCLEEMARGTTPGDVKPA